MYTSTNEIPLGLFPCVPRYVLTGDVFISVSVFLCFGFIIIYSLIIYVPPYKVKYRKIKKYFPFRDTMFIKIMN